MAILRAGMDWIGMILGRGIGMVRRGMGGYEFIFGSDL